MNYKIIIALFRFSGFDYALPVIDQSYILFINTCINIQRHFFYKKVYLEKSYISGRFKQFLVNVLIVICFKMLSFRNKPS